jgi:hypothetical protein
VLAGGHAHADRNPGGNAGGIVNALGCAKRQPGSLGVVS